MYLLAEDRLAPAAVSRYLTHAFVPDTWPCEPPSLLTLLTDISNHMSRRAILLPTDDLAAVFIADHSSALEKSFIFPRPPSDLPRRLANKRELHHLCKCIGIPCPETSFADSGDDVQQFIESAKFPVVAKMPESRFIFSGPHGVYIARTAQELLTIYRNAEASGIRDLVLQEYIPEDSAEDWICNGYVNPQTGCSIVFTGKKLRAYPPFVGPATLAVPARNEELARQTEAILQAINFAGIMDLDYRLDKRDGQLKLLDFNPRVGASFRMFEDEDGIDVVRALHLDLTGRIVGRSRHAESRTFIVEPHDLVASFAYLGRGGLTLRSWWRSLGPGRWETAWFSWRDPLPFLTMSVRLLSRAIRRLLAATRTGFRPTRTRSKPALSLGNSARRAEVPSNSD